MDNYVFVPMTQEQLQHHTENRESVARIVAKWRRFGYLSERDQTMLMIGLQNMRMSCNSTYLLDKTTDFSTKPDEVATLLEEILEEPQAKVVMFSQWMRMHELVQRRLDARGWQYGLFNGSVPTPKRKQVVDRFREDADCRLLLATDAGGVGLNLQHASTVINLDMPWNPAVLEQRNGRVHRLGQTQPVRVVNFVSEGTIEHGMLSLLSFKKGMFAGVLDGGERNVFLGKSRLGRFIETVEKATDSIPAGHEADELDDAESQPAASAEDSNGHAERVSQGREGGAGQKRRTEASSPSRPSTQQVAAAEGDPLSGLLQQGLSLLAQMAQASSGGGAGGGETSRGATTRGDGLQVVRNEQTGKAYLQMPMPDPQVVEQAMHALIQLAASFSGDQQRQ